MFKFNAMAISHSASGSRFRYQQGATLIEALVAIFVLAFGVLALMAAQLRSVVSIQEAENQTIVATAAQTLMEGMLANPYVGSGATAGQSIKSYNHYNRGNLATVCGTAVGINYVDATPLDKDTLALFQLCSFYQQLDDKLANAVIDNVSVTDNAGVYSIMVTWTMQANDAAGSAQGTVDSAGKMQYTYSLPVQD